MTNDTLAQTDFTAVELPAGFTCVNQALPENDRPVLAIRLSSVYSSKFEVLTAYYAPNRSKAYPWKNATWDNVGENGGPVIGWRYADSWFCDDAPEASPERLTLQAQSVVAEFHELVSDDKYDAFPTLESYTDYVESSIGALKIFDVVAGKTEQDFDTGQTERNYKVSHSELTITEAVELFRECRSYPFCEILVAGHVLYAR